MMKNEPSGFSDEDPSNTEFKIASAYHVYMYPDTPFHRYPDLYKSEKSDSGGDLSACQFNSNFMDGKYKKKPKANEKDWFREHIRMYNSPRFSLISPILRSTKYSELLSDCEMDKREAPLRRSKRIAEKNLLKHF